MLRDLRFGSRMLLKQPGFTVIAVLTLALGIGTTAAVFSLIQGVLLTPPPYQQPERLVLIPSARVDGTQASSPRLWPAAQWMDWRKEATSFDAIAAYGWSFIFWWTMPGASRWRGWWSRATTSASSGCNRSSGARSPNPTWGSRLLPPSSSATTCGSESSTAIRAWSAGRCG